MSGFLKGLDETGYIDGQNVTIEYRWAEGQNDRLTAMVADLVHRQVAVIAATSTPATLAAKAATTTIPIVFETELHVLNASSEGDFDGVFAKLIQLRAGGLVISGGPFFTSQSERLGALTARHAMPAIHQYREFVAAGGLLSYGSEATDAYRLAGNYTGRILKGDKAADLPVQQATKVELYINLRTAKALGLNIPNTLVGRADEVIE